MTIEPKYYTISEGRYWYAWIFGPIDIDDLQDRGHKFVEFKGCIVHSFLFSKECSGFSGRWDCINGWTR